MEMKGQHVVQLQPFGSKNHFSGTGNVQTFLQTANPKQSPSLRDIMLKSIGK